MVFRHDSTGISGLKDYTKLKNKTRYNFRIEQVKDDVTKKGKNIVYLKLMTDGIAALIDHSITFLDKGEPGEGMSVHFRKVIGVPFGGDDEVDSRTWIGKEFSAFNTHKEYNGALKDNLNGIEPIKTDKKSEDVPF